MWVISKQPSLKAFAVKVTAAGERESECTDETETMPTGAWASA